MKTPKSLWLPCAALALAALALTFSVQAADGKDASNPTGTWKWTFETQSGQTIESSLKLKLEGDQLSWTFIGRGGTETAIRDAKLRTFLGCSLCAAYPSS